MSCVRYTFGGTRKQHHSSSGFLNYTTAYGKIAIPPEWQNNAAMNRQGRQIVRPPVQRIDIHKAENRVVRKTEGVTL